MNTRNTPLGRHPALDKKGPIRILFSQHLTSNSTSSTLPTRKGVCLTPSAPTCPTLLLLYMPPNRSTSYTRHNTWYMAHSSSYIYWDVELFEVRWTVELCKRPGRHWNHVNSCKGYSPQCGQGRVGLNICAVFSFASA